MPRYGEPLLKAGAKLAVYLRTMLSRVILDDSRGRLIDRRSRERATRRERERERARGKHSVLCSEEIIIEALREMPRIRADIYIVYDPRRMLFVRGLQLYSSFDARGTS